MSLYVITAVRLDQDGEVERVRWAEADAVANAFKGQPHDVDVDRVVEALDHRDVVELRFETGQGFVSGGGLRRKVLPGGIENVTEQRPVEGRMLRDLPAF